MRIQWQEYKNLNQWITTKKLMLKSQSISELL
jgi:hypothetical protein